MVVPTSIRRELRTVAIATSVGIMVGVVVIGIGSRLAMRAIAATSDDRLKGVLTSDREPIGEITLEGTIGLILFVGVFGGVVMGAGYVAMRWLLPSDLRWRAVCTSLLVWCMGAAVIFDSEDFDFQVLEPQWLAVLMFSVLFLVAGWVIAAGIEVAQRRWPTGRGAWWRYTPIVLAAPVVPLLAMPVVVGLARSSSALRRVASLPAVLLVGRVLLVTCALALGLPALGEVVEIL